VRVPPRYSIVFRDEVDESPRADADRGAHTGAERAHDYRHPGAVAAAASDARLAESREPHAGANNAD